MDAWSLVQQGSGEGPPPADHNGEAEKVVLASTIKTLTIV